VSLFLVHVLIAATLFVCKTTGPKTEGSQILENYAVEAAGNFGHAINFSAKGDDERNCIAAMVNFYLEKSGFQTKVVPSNVSIPVSTNWYGYLVNSDERKNKPIFTGMIHADIAKERNSSNCNFPDGFAYNPQFNRCDKAEF